MITYSNSQKQMINSGYLRYEGGLRRNPAIRVMDREVSMLIRFSSSYPSSSQSLVPKDQFGLTLGGPGWGGLHFLIT